MSLVVARLLRWGRPSSSRPAYSRGHVELPVGRLVTRLGPNKSQIIVGKIVASRETPRGLEATIRLRDNKVGVETADEIAAGYLPAADVLLEPLTKDPMTFKPRARVLGVQLGTILDPDGEDGQIVSIDDVLVSRPDLIDDAAVRPIKPQAVKDAEQMLVEAGQGSSWWSNIT